MRCGVRRRSRMGTLEADRPQIENEFCYFLTLWPWVIESGEFHFASNVIWVDGGYVAKLHLCNSLYICKLAQCAWYFIFLQEHRLSLQKWQPGFQKIVICPMQISKLWHLLSQLLIRWLVGSYGMEARQTRALTDMSLSFQCCFMTSARKNSLREFRRLLNFISDKM